MNFTLDGGSDRQRAWVNNAIAACSYPLASLSTNVSVQWVARMPSNADARHPYMVTQAQDDGSCLVSIIDWADDPAAAGNQGLPDPARDLQDFYQSSFVHELGHVVTFSTFDPDGDDTDSRITTMCGLFWTAHNDPPVRRYGVFGDWDAGPLSWADEIREGVAEVFKLAFYQGAEAYQNRTNWNIDDANWSAYLGLIAPPGGDEVNTWDDLFPSGDTLPYFEVDQWLAGPGGVGLEFYGFPIGSISYEQTAALVPQTSGERYTSLLSSVKIDSISPVNGGGQALVALSAQIVTDEDDGPVAVSALLTVSGGSADWYSTGPGSLLSEGDKRFFPLGASSVGGSLLGLDVTAADSSSSLEIDGLEFDTFPCWLVLRVTKDAWTAEVWADDPWEEGNSAEQVVSIAPPASFTLTADPQFAPGAGGYTPALLATSSDANFELGDGPDGLTNEPLLEDSPSILVDEFRLDFEPPTGGGTVTGTYPFASVSGSMKAGSGLRGQLPAAVKISGRLPVGADRVLRPTAGSNEASLSVPFVYGSEKVGRGLRGQLKP